MKRNFLLFGILSLVGLTFFSCKKEEFSQEDLYGYWKENTDAGHYVRFMTAAQDTIYEDYLYGYEWTEEDEISEADVKSSRHRGGWFRWKLVQSDLTEIHLMENGGAEIPKVYTVTTLSSSKLEYKNETQKFSFTKVNR